jgi:hypothetical protein
MHPFSERKMRRWRGGSTVSEADCTVKSSAAARVAEGGGWRLVVKDDQRKLGRWAK